MSKKTIFISQPMKNVTYEEIFKKRKSIVEICKNIGFDIIDNISLDVKKEDACDYLYLLDGLRDMSYKDNVLVVFLADWQTARGCRIERNWCVEYNIPFCDEQTFVDKYSGVKKDETAIPPKRLGYNDEDDKTIKIFKSKEDWLDYRCKGIGGSDASCILGTNLRKSNVELYEEKTSKKPYCYDDNAAMKFGRDCEPILINLFLKDFPDVISFAKNVYSLDVHPTYPFIFGSLDAKIMRLKKSSEDETLIENEYGFLEIKTATPRTALDWAKWEYGKIPPQYLSQITHYFLVGNGRYTFAFLRVYLKCIEYKKDDVVLKSFQNTGYIRDYYFEYNDEMQKATAYLLEKEKEFWDCVEQKKQPDLILPSL